VADQPGSTPVGPTKAVMGAGGFAERGTSERRAGSRRDRMDANVAESLGGKERSSSTRLWLRE